MKAVGGWVKCYSKIRKGAKRGLPRAVRFIYLELADEARQANRNGVVELLGTGTLADALFDLLGGDRAEIEQAAALLPKPIYEGDDPMLLVNETGGHRYVTVRTFEEYNRTLESSTDRVRKHRAPMPPGPRKSAKAQYNPVTTETVDVTPREEKRREEEKERERAPELTPAEQAVRAELEQGRDLYPTGDVCDDAVDAAARRITRTVASEPKAARAKHTAPTILVESVAYARSWLASHPLATPTEVLAQVERKVTWVLGDIRAGRRDPKQRPGPGSGIDTDNEREELEKLERQRREERQREADGRRGADQARASGVYRTVQPAFMADLVKLPPKPTGTG